MGAEEVFVNCYNFNPFHYFSSADSGAGRNIFGSTTLLQITQKETISWLLTTLKRVISDRLYYNTKLLILRKSMQIEKN
jgi:hypothetical protein